MPTMVAPFAIRTTFFELYDLMINTKRSEEGTTKHVRSGYIQHNPLIPDGSVALGQFFGKITRERARARVVVHKIIAVGDYVWAHVNFLNLFNDDPADTGIAGVDIYKMDARVRRSSIGTRCSSWGSRRTQLRCWGRISARQSERDVLNTGELTRGARAGPPFLQSFLASG